MMITTIRFCRVDTGAEVATTTATNHSPHVPQKGDEIVLGVGRYIWTVQSRRLILSFHDRIEWNVYIA